jgi:ABC-type enterochelin transport system substrate-binding protein
MKKIKGRYTKCGKLVLTWRDRLARKIRVAHQAVRRGWENGLRESLKQARTAGDLLIKAKEKMGHGYFMAWRQRECQLSHATANIYMRVARNWAHIEANSELVANLGLGALDQWLRLGSATRAANRPLVEVVQTVLGREERVSKEYPALQHKLETVMAMTTRLQSVILVLTEREAQSTITTLLTLRRHLDLVLAEVQKHVEDFAPMLGARDAPY